MPLVKRTFLVELQIDPSIIAAGELPVIATSIRGDLIGAGHPVTNVQPWTGSGAEQSYPLQSPHVEP